MQNAVIINNSVETNLNDTSTVSTSESHHSSKRQELPFGNGHIHGIGDPRLELLGWRVFLPSNNTELNDVLPKDVQVLPESEYVQLRYALGVGEGVLDLPPANCFPLESNGDYLHGVSFQKGCYIGQELTARTHHTGVVRKRLMPFLLPSTFTPSIEINQEKLTGKDEKSIGKIRGVQNSYGLVLARIQDVLNSPEIKLKEHLVQVRKPLWWPVEQKPQLFAKATESSQ